MNHFALETDLEMRYTVISLIYEVDEAPTARPERLTTTLIRVRMTKDTIRPLHQRRLTDTQSSVKWTRSIDVHWKTITVGELYR